MTTKNKTLIKALGKLIDSGLSQTDVLNEFAKRRTPSENKLVEHSRVEVKYIEESCDCQIEIDDNALVSCEDDGHRGWVMAWLRVDDDSDSED